jgi:hypothetical protein
MRWIETGAHRFEPVRVAVLNGERMTLEIRYHVDLPLARRAVSDWPMPS